MEKAAACCGTLKFAPCSLVHEQLSGDVKERHEKENPLPVKSVVRWTAVFFGVYVLERLFCAFQTVSH